MGNLIAESKPYDQSFTDYNGVPKFTQVVKTAPGASLANDFAKVVEMGNNLNKASVWYGVPFVAPNSNSYAVTAAKLVNPSFALNNLEYGMVPSASRSLPQTISQLAPYDIFPKANYLDSLTTGNRSNLPSVGGVLIDKAAELIGTNLSDIRGATYDPVSRQIVFLGSNNGTLSGVNGVNLDYFFTAVQAVYGSAVPPFVTLDPPAGAATPWTDWGDGDGVFESGETGGFVLRYNPIWAGEDQNIDVRIKAQWSGVKYDMTVHLVASQMNQPPVIISAGGRYAMKLNYAGAEGLPREYHI